MADSFAFKSFSAEVAAGNQLPADQQVFGTRTPEWNQDGGALNHGDIGLIIPPPKALPEKPPAPGTRKTDHSAEQTHASTEAEPKYAGLNIGNPFVTMFSNIRHLRTARYNPAGQVVNPADVTGAPVVIQNSHHKVELPRMKTERTPLRNVNATGPRFSNNPGFYGVSDNKPTPAPINNGPAVVAQASPDPIVVNQIPGPVFGQVDYSVEY